MDYKNGKIYRLVCNDTGLQYIGSTTQPLSKRLYEHKKDYGRWKEGKRNMISSVFIIENNNYEIVLVEEYPCENKNQLHSRERYWIEKMGCVNKYKPMRTKEDNMESTKRYNENNKDKVKETQQNYREKNREVINKKALERYYLNKDSILDYQSQKHICECGVNYTQHHKSRHQKSKKHQRWVDSQKEKKEP